MQVPCIEKITLNMGVGDAKTNSKLLDAAMEQLAQIAGQQPRAYACQELGRRPSSCARSMPIGCKVTLRGERMYEFLDRLLTIALPRIRDFRGIKAEGVRQAGQLRDRHHRSRSIFPEVDYDADRHRPRSRHRVHHQERRAPRAPRRCSTSSACRSASPASRP